MRTLLVLLTCLAAAGAFSNINDKVIQEYGRVAILRDCFGERIFKRYEKKVQVAVATCRNKAYEPEQSPPSDLVAKSEKADIMFDRARVQDLSTKMRLAVSNSTCVLQQLGYIDDSYNIQYETIIHEIEGVGHVDKQLMEDLLETITQCKDFTTCIPLDRIQYPMRPAEMKYLNFSICRNQGTIAACLKKQFRNEKPDYNYVAAQDIVDTSAADEKLISLLWRNTNTGIF